MNSSNFWEELEQFSNHLAFIDENNKETTYQELAKQVNETANYLQKLGKKQLGFILTSNSLNSVISYLACLKIGHVPLLLPHDTSKNHLEKLISTYQPRWILGESSQGIRVPGINWNLELYQKKPTHCLSDELALLLSTSGSTGSPKLVRLSYKNLNSNARQISNYLNISYKDKTLTTLPFNYSYGLSILNSYLSSGASIVLTDKSVITPEFSQLIQEHRITSISGVPYIYQMLWRTGFNKKDFPSIKTLTQAGGKLDNRFTSAFLKLAKDKGWNFYVMYGQTEATARISYVPPEKLESKMGSIGISIPEGQLTIDEQTSELIYSGPNVMLGYANSIEDLSLGDEQQGILRTGDLATQDSDGYFYIQGRLKRFIKITGNRIGLDEVEQHLESYLEVPTMVSGTDDKLIIWTEAANENTINKIKDCITQQYKIHHSYCTIKLVDALPLLNSGKKDYSALTS